jgi:hypothetical protein
VDPSRHHMGGASTGVWCHCTPPCMPCGTARRGQVNTGHRQALRTRFASSSTGRNSRAGPNFGKPWKGLRPADRDYEAETGGVSTDSAAKMHLPAPGRPLGAAGRNWPRPFHQLVEISKGTLRALRIKSFAESASNVMAPNLQALQRLHVALPQCMLSCRRLATVECCPVVSVLLCALVIGFLHG